MGSSERSVVDCTVVNASTIISDETLHAAGVRVPVAQFENLTALPGRVDLGLSFAPSTPGAVPSNVFRVGRGAPLPAEHAMNLDLVAVLKGPTGSQFSFDYHHELGFVSMRPPDDATAEPSRAVDGFLTVTNTGTEPGELGILAVFGPQAPVPSDAIVELLLQPGASVDTFVDFTITGPPPNDSDASVDGDSDWNDIAPRIGLSYALGAERRTLLRASYSRFADQLATTGLPGRPSSYAYFYWATPEQGLAAAPPRFYTYRLGAGAVSNAEPATSWPSWLEASRVDRAFGADATFHWGETTEWSRPDLTSGIEYRSNLREVNLSWGDSMEFSSGYSRGFKSSHYGNDQWRLNEKWSFNLGVRYDEPPPTQMWWYFPGRDQTAPVEVGSAPPYRGSVFGDLFEFTPDEERRCWPFPFLSTRQKIAGGALAVVSLGFAFLGTGIGDSTETRQVRITNVRANAGGGASGPAAGPTPVVVPARLLQFIGGGDHPAFLEDYRDPLTGASLVGRSLSFGLGCASTEGIPSGAIIELDLTGPGGRATWAGPLDPQARVKVVGGINAPGAYTVTGGSWFLPTNPGARTTVSLGTVNPAFSVPSPPNENPCNPANLPAGVPLAASNAGPSAQPGEPAPSEPSSRLVSVTTERDAFPWSVPIGVGTATFALGALWRLDRKQQPQP